jgi:hypothetical protein
MTPKIAPLRDRIFEVLKASPTTVAEDLQALSQCVAHLSNRALVEGIARECGLSLVRFLTNDALELYYDIKRGRHEMGYISKGWEDPGFRIGDLVQIGEWDRDVLKGHSHHIMRFCAMNGIAMTIPETPTTIALQLDGVIYSEGFNQDTFLKTLDSLNACVEKIRTLIPGGQNGPHSPSGYFCGRLAEASGRSH